MNDIQRKTFSQPDRQQVQDNAIAAVEADPEPFFEAYGRDIRSFGGRYVAADLFKETFPAFSASKEARNRYNTPIHNTAAVLSAELFRRNLAEPADAGRNAVYFLTGSPGAGKTSMVLKQNVMPDTAHMIFEGQLSNFDTGREKIQQVLDAGFHPHIVAVHANPLNAIQNTLQRFAEEGRGASVEAIANIQGNLPGSLERLARHFGDSVTLEVIDVRNRDRPVQYAGFEHVDVLKSEGSYEQIKRQLEHYINDLRADGRLTDDAYRQAAGLAPADRLELGTQGPGGYQGIASGRGSEEEGRAPAVLDPRSGSEQAPPADPAAPNTNDAKAQAAKEAASRLVLESEMDKLGLAEPARDELRAQLNAAFESARSSGQDLQIPTPQIIEPEFSGSPAAPDIEPAKDAGQNLDHDI
jgi:hypothetical protein